MQNSPTSSKDSATVAALRPPEKKRRKTVRRFVFRIVLPVVAVVIAFVLRVASQGLPQAWTNAIADAISTDVLSFEMERVRLSAFDGIHVGKLRVYPKRMVSEPILEFNNATVMLAPKRNMHPLTWVTSVDIGHFVIPAKITRIDFSGVNTAGAMTLPQTQLTRVTCRRATVFNAEFSDLSAHVSVADSRLNVTDIRVNTVLPHDAPQIMEGTLALGINEFFIDIDGAGKLKPEKVCTILDALALHVVSAEIARLQTPADAPDVALALRYHPHRDNRALTVELDGKNLIYSDVPVLACAGTIRVAGSNAWQRVDIAPLHATRPEGEIDIALAIDIPGETLAFDGVTGFDPRHILTLARVAPKGFTLPANIAAPSVTKASGTVDITVTNTPTRTQIAGTIAAPSVTIDRLNFENAQAEWHVTDTHYTVKTAMANLLGGVFIANADFTHPVKTNDVAFAAKAEFLGIRVAEFVDVFDTALAENTGVMDLVLTPSGVIPVRPAAAATSEAGTDTTAKTAVDFLHGNGSLRIRDTRIFRFPLFAGLTDFLANHIPGVDFLVAQNDLTARFSYADRNIKLGSFKIDGSVFSISGFGDISFDGDLNLIVKVHLMNRNTWVGKAVYYALFPISKVFELQATGTLKDTHWASGQLSSGKNRPSKK